LNYDSLGIFGCKVPGITPNLDQLASDGLKFNHDHVNIAVCQPSRQSIMTSRYPDRNGAEGFNPIADVVPTLQEQLHAAGYLNGILGKEIHLLPKHRYCWDHYITQEQLASGAGIGRSPEQYHHYTAVHRCDQSAGAILKALKESGFGNNTLVMFLSDNGIAVPFATANCYLNSTKTP
jgi:N-sulfoglucosamine sulfohydrolase